MRKRCVVLLNYSRSQESVQWFFDLYDKFDELEVNDYSFMYVSKDRSTDFCDINLQVGECSIPTMRNTVLDKCVELDYTDVHIIDDDIQINDIQIIELYEELSVLTGSHYICNSFTTHSNYTINKPNPRLKLHIGHYGSESITDLVFSAHLSIGYSYYNMVEVGSNRYDDKLHYLWNQAYVSSLQTQKKIPFLNFFVDLYGSDKYISRTCNELFEPMDESLKMTDQQRLSVQGITWPIFNMVDTVIDYYVKRFKKEV